MLFCRKIVVLKVLTDIGVHNDICREGGKGSVGTQIIRHHRKSGTLYTKLTLRIWQTCLKGPKREIFVAGIFTEIRPVWEGDLETRPKNLKSLCLGPYITLYFLGFLF
jgi:hypothetical protein